MIWRRHYVTVAFVLIWIGVTIALGPSFLIEALDDRMASTQQKQADQWVQQHPLEPVVADVTKHLPKPRPKVRPPVAPPVASHDDYLLEIPKLGLRRVVHLLEPAVLTGRNTPDLKRYGLGQIPYTEALKNVDPGQAGTTAITGHRTTSGAPFRNLHLLQPGDAIVIRKGSVEQRWVVVGTKVVRPQQVEVIRSRPGTPQLMLLACTPPFSARERIVVSAMPLGRGGD